MTLPPRPPWARIRWLWPGSFTAVLLALVAIGGGHGLLATALLATAVATYLWGFCP